jgi:hypothetical protein
MVHHTVNDRLLAAAFNATTGVKVIVEIFQFIFERPERSPRPYPSDYATSIEEADDEGLVSGLRILH